MITTKDLIESGKGYVANLTEYQETLSPELGLHEDIDLLIEQVESLNETLVGELPKVKKSYVVSGSFRLGGRIDLKPGTAVTLNIFGNDYACNITEQSNINDWVRNVLTEGQRVPDEDIIYIDSMVNVQTDQFDFDFVFQSNVNWPEGLYITMKVPGKAYSMGTSEFQKVYLRGTKVEIPSEIYDYPLFGFAVPYGMTMDSYNKCFTKIIGSTANIQKGTLADMRGFPASMIDDDEVNYFKNREWQRIFTPKSKYYRQANGQYLKY